MNDKWTACFQKSSFQFTSIKSKFQGDKVQPFLRGLNNKFSPYTSNRMHMHCVPWWNISTYFDNPMACTCRLQRTWWWESPSPHTGNPVHRAHQHSLHPLSQCPETHRLILTGLLKSHTSSLWTLTPVARTLDTCVFSLSVSQYLFFFFLHSLAATDILLHLFMGHSKTKTGSTWAVFKGNTLLWATDRCIKFFFMYVCCNWIHKTIQMIFCFFLPVLHLFYIVGVFVPKTCIFLAHLMWHGEWPCCTSAFINISF